MATSEQARRLHKSAIVIDGCSFFSTGWHGRLKKAGVTALQMTVPWPEDDTAQAIRRYCEYFQLVAREPRLALVQRAADIRRLKREGRVGFILGSQDARMLGGDVWFIEVFARLGVRVIQLCYNERNLLADGCLEPTNAGLSRLGRAAIREMNRAGIVVDLTHVGERSSLEALEASEKPCLFSHSNPRARANNPRNITDEQIRKCAAAGGVIGLSPWSPICWTGGATPPRLNDFIDHVEYVVDLVGVDHVAIGTDSEATPGAYPSVLHAQLTKAAPIVYGPYRTAFPANPATEGFRTMEDLPNVTSALLSRRWKDGSIRKLLGGNLLRVYAEVWGG